MVSLRAVPVHHDLSDCMQWYPWLHISPCLLRLCASVSPVDRRSSQQSGATFCLALMMRYPGTCCRGTASLVLEARSTQAAMSRPLRADWWYRPGYTGPKVSTKSDSRLVENIKAHNRVTGTGQYNVHHSYANGTAGIVSPRRKRWWPHRYLCAKQNGNEISLRR